MNYPDGIQVRVGDSVLLNHGDNQGIVYEVIETDENKHKWGVEKTGLMIESPCYGLVFIPIELMVGDEITFVSRQLA